MLEKIVQYVQKLVKTQEPIDPSTFGDALAETTEWTPAKRGGTNFRTHKLIEVSPDRMEFRASAGAWLFYMIFLVAGLAMIGSACYTAAAKNNPERIRTFLILGSVGLVFAAVGGSMLYFGTKRVVFDKATGYFYKGSRGPDQVFQTESIKGLTSLDQIHALQLIKELCTSKNSSYYSYELNLVLKDGSRINAIDHGNHKKIRADAQTLCDFLGKPLWDAT